MNAFEHFLSSRPLGFITEPDLPELIRLHRLCQCVVRCGGCRFTAAAQDVAHLIRCIEKNGDYVRDVSVTAYEMGRAKSWYPELSEQPVTISPLVNLGAITAKVHKDLDAWRVEENKRLRRDFNEADCGGAFDGNQVISDADPGL